MARATKKCKYICLNGPYKGKELLLTTPSTLPFSTKGFSGRYVAGYLKKRTVGCHPLDHAILSDLDKKAPLYIAITAELDDCTTLIWEEVKC